MLTRGSGEEVIFFYIPLVKETCGLEGSATLRFHAKSAAYAAQ
jgi:hypothetical protein